MDQVSTPDYEFEGFRLDTAHQVLYSPAGEPLALPSRAFETLRYLVERAGEVVDKAALMKAVWPNSVVEENNLSQCILTLRKTLGETAGERRFILTVPGRGFKFVAHTTVIPNAGVRRVAPPESAAAPAASDAADRSASVAEPAPQGWRHRSTFVITAALAILLAVGMAVALLAGRSHPVTDPAEYAPLTDVTAVATAPAVSADGRLLAFIRGDGPFMSSGQIWLKLLPDGEPVQLSHGSGLIFAPTFTPDGAHVAYTSIDPSPGSTWDTWIVPITGGEATKLLPNASGLTYTGPHEVMYSEFKQGLHLGIVSSLEDRSRHRDIYLPAHERGMAHYSYLSPDRGSVLVVEMDGTGNWQRCRVVPFDGGGEGKQVGPEGACVSAAWSPDGRWMYFAVERTGRTQLWRQRYPDGDPEQITFGPMDVDTVSCAPDGKSLLASVGRDESALWLHNAAGDHRITDDGYVVSPQLSGDAQRVYFLIARSSTAPYELSRLEIASGRTEHLIPGFAVTAFDVSADESQVVFTTEQRHRSQVWIAPLDRHAPPRVLTDDGDQARLDDAGHVFYRKIGQTANYLHRINLDGSGDVRVFERPILDLQSVAPNGQWVTAAMPIEGRVGGAWLIPTGAGEPHLLRGGWWPSRWSRDGKTLYLEVGAGDDSQRHGRTAVLPLGPDGLPSLPIAKEPPASQLIPHPETSLSVGADPSVYAYLKGSAHRNIYRIPLH